MLKNSKLYLILDTAVAPYDRLLTIAQQAVDCGVDMIQLRDKNGSAEDILKFSRQMVAFLKEQIPFIVNDRVDLAMASNASGVHLGQEDLPLAIARRLMGQKALIGVSCQTLKQAVLAETQGADYIGFGSVFKTLTKPHREPMDLRLLSQVISKIKIPVFPIGGIGFKNISHLKELGVERVAICRDICLAADIKSATRCLREVLENGSCCFCLSASGGNAR